MADPSMLEVGAAGAMAVVILREVIWAVRTLKGDTPDSRMREVFIEMTERLKELRHEIHETHHLAERIWDKVEDL